MTSNVKPTACHSAIKAILFGKISKGILISDRFFRCFQNKINSALFNINDLKNFYRFKSGKSKAKQGCDSVQSPVWNLVAFSVTPNVSSALLFPCASGKRPVFKDFFVYGMRVAGLSMKNFGLDFTAKPTRTVLRAAPLRCSWYKWSFSSMNPPKILFIVSGL